MPKFSIIIVTYNSEMYIRQCLGSIVRQDLLDYEVIMVDNASTDRTVDMVSLFREKTRLEINETNKGFSAAVNKGIGLSRGEYVLTLNPDVILKPDFLSVVARDMDTLSKDIGMLGVKILKMGEENIIDSTGLIMSRAIRFFDRGSGKKDIGQYGNEREILGPCAAAGVYKKEMLEDIKIDDEYFDKDFFYLLEDFDIALRARKKGWKTLYLPEAVCYHQRNGSCMGDKDRQYLAFRNRYFLIIKNIKINPWFLFYFIIYDIPRVTIMLFTNGYTLRAVKEIGQFFPAMMKKRKKDFYVRENSRIY